MTEAFKIDAPASKPRRQVRGAKRRLPVQGVVNESTLTTIDDVARRLGETRSATVGRVLESWARDSGAAE